MPEPSGRVEPVEVFGDGRTVWINNAAGCLGRFGRGGIDVHRPLPEQMAGGKECLYCTHAQPTHADWLVFVAKMKELHAVDVPLNLRPKFLGPM